MARLEKDDLSRYFYRRYYHTSRCTQSMQPSSQLRFQCSASSPSFLSTLFAQLQTLVHACTYVCTCTRAYTQACKRTTVVQMIDKSESLALCRRDSEEALCALKSRQIVRMSWIRYRSRLRFHPESLSRICIYESSGGELAVLTLNQTSTF